MSLPQCNANEHGHGSQQTLFNKLRMRDDRCRKIVQKQAYDVLSHKYGILLIFGAFVGITVSAFYFGEVINLPTLVLFLTWSCKNCTINSQYWKCWGGICLCSVTCMINVKMKTKNVVPNLICPSNFNCISGRNMIGHLNSVVSNHFHSVKILLFSSPRSRDFDGTAGPELDTIT